METTLSITIGVILIIVLTIVFYRIRLRARITDKNHCPVCHQNYGQRAQPPFTYELARLNLNTEYRTYRCLSCKSYFFVPKTAIKSPRDITTTH
jgi:hypothetical protein